MGIDVRPSDGKVYGFGSTGRFYTVNLSTGVATRVSGPLPYVNGLLGVDWDPDTDRLRAVQGDDSNLSIDVDAGTSVVDGALHYAGGDANAGRDPNVVASAYSFDGPPKLYDIDTRLRVLARQDPASGALSTIGALGIGQVLVEESGFDISSDTGTAFAELTTSNPQPRKSKLYAVNLTTGAVSLLGQIGPVGDRYNGLTVLPAH